MSSLFTLTKEQIKEEIINTWKYKYNGYFPMKPSQQALCDVFSTFIYSVVPELTEWEVQDVVSISMGRRQGNTTFWETVLSAFPDDVIIISDSFSKNNVQEKMTKSDNRVLTEHEFMNQTPFKNKIIILDCGNFYNSNIIKYVKTAFDKFAKAVIVA